MAGLSADLAEHLATGVTSVCRCWAIERRDGVVHGFTDHDCALSFDGITFRADTGLSALALQQSTGLSVDNTEALGVLSDAAVRDEDIDTGRFDNAEVRAWLVNWADPDMRWLQFRGSIGDITRSGGAFRAELRGLSDQLNRPLGRVYQKPCTAVLGDRGCGFDVTTPGFSVELIVEEVTESQYFTWSVTDPYEPGWFARGRLEVLEGASSGLWGNIKRDYPQGEGRRVELWEPMRGGIGAGDRLRLIAGCDKRFETCKLKFANHLNFQGFPDIPGEDWVMSVPKQNGVNTGGSRR